MLLLCVTRIPDEDGEPAAACLIAMLCVTVVNSFLLCVTVVNSFYFVWQEFQMKMESLQQRREELERKEYQLKESLLKFDKFLKVSTFKSLY